MTDEFEFEGDGFSLTCTEWTGPRDLSKNKRNMTVLDELYDNSFFKYIEIAVERAHRF